MIKYWYLSLNDNKDSSNGWIEKRQSKVFYLVFRNKSTCSRHTTACTKGVVFSATASIVKSNPQWTAFTLQGIPLPWVVVFVWLYCIWRHKFYCDLLNGMWEMSCRWTRSKTEYNIFIYRWIKSSYW